MQKEIIMAGFGGQGVMLMGQLLAYAGMLEGKEVSWLPSYGPEMRGGTANCHVIVADELIASPFVSNPDAVVAMNLPSMEKFAPQLKPGGTLFINSSLIQQESPRDDIKVLKVPATEIANEMGNVRVANMVMLGKFLQETGYAGQDSLINALEKALGEGKQDLIPINKEALDRGASLVMN